MVQTVLQHPTEKVPHYFISLTLRDITLPMSYIAQHYIFNEEVAFSLNEKTKNNISSYEIHDTPNTSR